MGHKTAPIGGSPGEHAGAPRLLLPAEREEHDTAALERVDELIERSSLGARGAQQLRRRTKAADAAAALRISRLRNRVVYPRNAHDGAAAAIELVGYLLELGYHGQADHILHEWFPQEGADHRRPGGRPEHLLGSGCHPPSSRSREDAQAGGPRRPHPGAGQRLPGRR